MVMRPVYSLQDLNFLLEQQKERTVASTSQTPSRTNFTPPLPRFRRREAAFAAPAASAVAVPIER